MRKSRKIFYLILIVTAFFIYKANMLNAVNIAVEEHSTVENNAIVDKAVTESQTSVTEVATATVEEHSEGSNNEHAAGHEGHVLPADLSLLPTLVFAFLFIIFLCQIIISKKNKKTNSLNDDSNKKKVSSHDHGHSSHAASH